MKNRVINEAEFNKSIWTDYPQILEILKSELSQGTRLIPSSKFYKNFFLETYGVTIIGIRDSRVESRF